MFSTENKQLKQSRIQKFPDIESAQQKPTE